MRLTRRAFVAATPALNASAQNRTGFASRWRGSRIWAGPQYWANPLQDWRLEDGVLIAQAGVNRTLHLLTHQIAPSAQGTLTMTVQVAPPSAIGEESFAGFRIGVRGQLDDYRNALVSPAEWIDAVLRSDGRLLLDGVESTDLVPIAGPATLELRVEAGQAELRAGGVIVRKTIATARLVGNMALIAGTPHPPASRPIWRFNQWTATGTLLTHNPEQTFGPVLWTQYTVSRGILKLTALFPPLGTEDRKTARLEVQHAGRWRKIAEATIDPLSRTATFRVAGWNASQQTPYRVVYLWQSQSYQWSGLIRSEPGAGSLKLGVFSCDNGYAFPLPRLTANVKIHDPDLLFFAGDQIYENYGGFGFVREPADLAMLDYLRKFWQFGWTWRELLRDRPSVVIPDDHDVFQGNIWGQGGRKIPKGREQGFTYGGYVEPPEWVNAVQRTQSSHLPDPVDPAPVEQGISVYFTELLYGGVSFAIVEDRKFKTGPESAFPNGVPRPRDPAALDVDGAQLFGQRQEAFLSRWAKDRNAPFKVVLSQTILCKVTTHSGPELRPSERDLDSGAWPQSGRRRALTAIRDAQPIMIHGDQHLGALVRHGLDQWDDGPVAFMVPGTANGFPRAWWPAEPKPDARYFDGLGNRMTILAVANPERGSNLLPRASTHPEELAHRKGSGYGMVRFDASRRTATFEIWHYLFDAGRPRPEDQFEGFPRTLTLSE
jgi:alkaline phosphatase D